MLATQPSPRERTLGEFKKPRQDAVATTDEILSLIEQKQLQDTGCGAIDLPSLVAALLSPDTRLRTFDRNLDHLARRLGVTFAAPGR